MAAQAAVVEQADVVEAVAGLDIDDNDPIKITYLDHEWNLTKKQLRMSEFFTSALQDQSAAVINVSSQNVSLETFELVVQFLQERNGKTVPHVERPIKSTILSEICSDAEAVRFAESVWEKGMPTVYEILAMANYLIIDSLLHLIAAKFATTLKGKSIAYVREQLLLPKQAAPSAEAGTEQKSDETEEDEDEDDDDNEEDDAEEEVEEDDE